MPLVPSDERLPWGESGFSKRMLAEHLSQEHDLASRRLATVDEHVRWLHDGVLKRQPGRVLDLGCGPGLYTERLAGFGHSCTGIDIAPAAIAYADRRAAELSLPCEYRLADVRTAVFERSDLVLLLYSELNTFNPSDARDLVRRAVTSLTESGTIVIEISTAAAVRGKAVHSPTWRKSDGGLFSSNPHKVLHEAVWSESDKATAERWSVVCEAGEQRQYRTTTWVVDWLDALGIRSRIESPWSGDEYSLVLLSAD